MSDNFQVGDFVSFTYETKEVYPGRILSKKDNGKYEVEIFISQRGASELEVEVVIGKESQLKMRG